MKEHWVWLQNALGYGWPYVNELFSTYAGAEDVYNAARLNALKLPHKAKASVKSALLNSDLTAAQKIITESENNGIKVITYADNNYPESLKNLPDAPLVLYAKGNASLLNGRPNVAIVGARNPSDFGKKSAYSLGLRLAKGGITVVSGGALGCDTAAHIGALKGGNTISVLGCGILNGYLKENAELRNQIANKGLLLSEFPTDYPASKYTFPVRNRIISGISLGTVVVEASEKSGALITANCALEQGKDVFVVPGNPGDSAHKGSNALLRDGAQPLLEANDIFFLYMPKFPDIISIEKAYEKSSDNNVINTSNGQTVQSEKIIKKNMPNTLSIKAKSVYNCLDKQIFHPNEILPENLTAADVLAALTELEIYGLVSAIPGGRYKLK